MTKKQQIIAALYAFIRQRSGIEFGNYGDVSSFRAEQRSITKDLHHARRLIRDVELRDSITADDILKAAQHAYSGRLTIVERADGAIAIDYCTGQYFPTEYRRAVCAVMASVLWDYTRANYGAGFEASSGRQITGDELRASFRREYGRAIASRWFN